MTDFNVNDYVSVRLTDAGRAHHRADFDEWTGSAGVKLRYRPPVEDAEGWSKWQLWQLMNTFGSQCVMGCPVPFLTGIRIHTEERSS